MMLNGGYSSRADTKFYSVDSTLVKRNSKIKQLKTGIWLYLWLLLFEGALRKWFLPGLATPLLLVRDPVGVWLIARALSLKVLPINGYIIAALFISTLCFISTLLLGHGNLLVALYGLRTLIIHFPLVFVIGAVFDRNDVLRVGQIMLYTSLPMIVLVIVQFYSPQSAWVNIGVGGDTAGAGFSGALGYFRPPGTFSFTNGNTLYWIFIIPFLFYFLLNKKEINSLALLLSIGAFILSIPFSISRALFFQTILSLVFLLIAVVFNPKTGLRLILSLIFLGGIIVVVLQNNVVSTATEVFTTRFESANENEGGLEGVLIDRFLGGMVGAITNSEDLPLFGYGLGMGTNVGSQLMAGKRIFLIAEEEWGRIIGELGILLGLLLIVIRISLAARLAKSSFTSLRSGDLLPWFLLSVSALIITQGGWAQPTSLGFFVILSGLQLASLKEHHL